VVETSLMRESADDLADDIVDDVADTEETLQPLDLGLIEAHGRLEPLQEGGVGGSFWKAAYAFPTCCSTARLSTARR
jgi:hypothetical protein